jgi:hypothetical protein
MGYLWDLIAEETRQSFTDLQNLFLSLDIKSSIVLAIDAILLAALSLIPNFANLDIIIRVLIFAPLFFSLISAICCLCPRKWDKISGENLVREYEEAEDPNYVACEISKTRSDLEHKLQDIYIKKLSCFNVSAIYMIMALFGEFVLFIYSFS